jgi:hypothetical protein
MENLTLNELGQAHTIRHAKYGDHDGGALSSIIAQRSDEEQAVAWSYYASKGIRADDVSETFVDESPLYEQATEVDQLLVLFKEMEYRKLTPDVALTQLYGEVTSESAEDPIEINRRLPRLAI